MNNQKQENKKVEKSKKIEKDKTLLVSDFNNSVEKVVNYYLLNEYVVLSKKLWKSKAIFTFLSLSTMIMSTIIVILTMFVIGKDIGGHKMYFVVISIISSFIAFITGIEGIFRFKRRKDLYSSQIEELKKILEYIDDRVAKKRSTDHIIRRVSDKFANINTSDGLN